jgi:hypothetical protein
LRHPPFSIPIRLLQRQIRGVRIVPSRLAANWPDREAGLHAARGEPSIAAKKLQSDGLI